MKTVHAGIRDNQCIDKLENWYNIQVQRFGYEHFEAGHIKFRISYYRKERPIAGQRDRHCLEVDASEIE